MYLLLCLEHDEPELKSESEHKSMYTQMVSPETVGERCRIYSGWMKGVQDLIRIIARSCDQTISRFDLIIAL